jgi:hypothetical protein
LAVLSGGKFGRTPDWLVSGSGGGEVREVLDSIGDTCPECTP